MTAVLTALVAGAFAVSKNAAVSLAIKSAIIGALPLLWIRLSPQLSAAARHAVLAAAFAGLMLLPAAAAWAPSVGIPIPEWLPSPHAVRMREIPAIVRAEAGGPAPRITGASPTPRPSVSEVLLMAWTAGTCICLVPLLTGLWRTRRFRHAGEPWRGGHAREASARSHVRPGVRIVLHPDAVVPMTFGVLRPTVVLPPDAVTWDDDDLSRALSHEVAHVDRRDWAVHALARAATAFYWFNPVVWIAWRRLRLEAERACDDIVVRQSDRFAYAEQLIRLASRLAAPAIGRALVLPMAGRDDLSARIGSVLDEARCRDRARRAHVVAAGCAAVVIVCTVSSVAAVDRSDQWSGVASAVTDALPIPPDDPGFAIHPDWRVSDQAGGVCAPWGAVPPSTACLWLTGMTLRELVTFAFRSTAFEPPSRPIVGGPPWADQRRFDVVVRAGGNPAFETPDTSRWATLMRDVLADRFSLGVHHESRSLPTYVLTGPVRASSLASGIRPARRECTAWTERVTSAPPTPRPAACGSELGSGYFRSGATTMSELAGALSSVLNSAVADQTRLPGTFAVDLAWTAGDRSSVVKTLAVAGLNLKATTGPVDVLVIDRASLPPASGAGALGSHS